MRQFNKKEFDKNQKKLTIMNLTPKVGPNEIGKTKGF